MLFNSLAFALFLPVVFVLYWTVFSRTTAVRNAFLIVAGYVFYGWWDIRFLFLLIMSSLVDYVVGILLSRTDRTPQRKALLGFSLVTQLGLLATFKYFDWFATSFAQAAATLGWHVDDFTLGLVLPVGISFYTFQTLSYTIDVYRRKTDAVRAPLQFFAFVGFFPQLMAGPIERASHMLPQFGKPAFFDPAKAKDGVRQILWGLFKKVVVADTCAIYVDNVYGNLDAAAGSTVALATILFAFRIYGDFSGYSDIAVGSARLFGFDLMRNFAYPYFSRDMAEFWRRWHISLSTWFRDYLYIPLGGSRGGKAMALRNSMIVFTVSGIWHGANWTFVFWGVLNGLYFVPLLLAGSNRQHLNVVAHDRWLPNLRELGSMALTFALACLAWVAFRANNVDHMLTAYRRIFSSSIFSVPAGIIERNTAIAVGCTGLMVLLEWISRDREYGLAIDGRLPRWGRFAVYYGIVALIIAFAPLNGGEFIYFQF